MTHSIVRTIAAAAAATALLAMTAPAQAADYGRDDTRAYPAEDGYPVPQGPGQYQQPPPSQYHQSYKDDGAPPPPRRTAECLSKYGIRGALNEQGWHAFDGVEQRGPVTFMTARNDGGRRFELQFDSCTGSVIEAHPVAVYYETPPPRYYEPRPAVGLYFYGGGHRHWR